MVGSDEAWFAEDCIERKVLDPSAQITSGKYRKRSVLHDRDAPQISNRCFISIVIPWRYLGVYCRCKSIQLQSAAGFRGKHTLRKHHDPVVRQARPLSQCIHALTRNPRAPIQQSGRSGSEFAFRMIASVDSE